MTEIKIDKTNAGQRLDKLLLKYLNRSGKAFVYKMLRKKNIKLNGKKAEGNEILAENDIIALYLADETIEKFRTETVIKRTEKKPAIIYEDENILAANKPAGLLVQGDKNESAENLNDMLLSYLKEKNEIPPMYKPGVANRLDRNTGGIVLMAKNLAAAQALALAFKENTIEKHYICAVKGSIDKSGEISGWHSKDSENKVLITSEEREGAAYVKTQYRPVCKGDEYTVLDVKLITGKSHQIRESFELIGHPVVGDPKYGDRETNVFFKREFGLNHQLLYAVQVKFSFKEGILAYLDQKEIKCVPDRKAAAALKYIKAKKENKI